ncbi:Putative aminophospholipid-translocase [Savitreella phatthalungensis]
MPRRSTISASKRRRDIALHRLSNRASRESDLAERDELDDLPSDGEGIGDDTSSGAPLLNDVTHSLKAESGVTRTLTLNGAQQRSYPSNALSNAKYNFVTFLPLTLFEQFKYFFNLYFLLVALSQLVPALRIGLLATYVVPLAFVLAVTMAQEALDELVRRRRDNEANAEMFDVVSQSGLTAARDIKVGDILRLHKDRRIPADAILLKTDDSAGEAFIRTDQLDGETDWKLKVACPATQQLPDEQAILDLDGELKAGAPIKSIHEFSGSLTLRSQIAGVTLTVDNALWANTVLASSASVLAVVVYTGSETRQAMNTSKARLKVGLLELEINRLSKMLCIFTLFLALVLVALHGFGSSWYVDITRFLILFSTIVPISLRVNLDLAKGVYARQIENDASISETVVRTSTIPEDLGRIEYLLTDKTGTLTRNDMEMKKLHVGTVSFAGEAMDDVKAFVLGEPKSSTIATTGTPQAAARASRREIGGRVRELVTALAVCHNVTPSHSLDSTDTLDYQAASPDELAIVKWTSTIGLTLIGRDRTSLKLRRGANDFQDYEILHVFPFTSDTKRMGIVVRESSSGQIIFYEKGADSVMASIVAANDWLDEEVGNMAREGLRTLVIGRKVLSEGAYSAFLDGFGTASLALHDRESAVQQVVASHLEHNLELLGLTGVEDKLQEDVKRSLEFLRNAGIRIWMLTGDKVETARCIAVSAKLVSRGQFIRTITKLDNAAEATTELEWLRGKRDAALLVDGTSLQYLLDNFRDPFIDVVLQLPAVICCRCSPTQKAELAILVRAATGKRVCCIGDGGNDVSMIQAADVGIGIVGKEGRQASLAADFSVLGFSALPKLLVWHGRNSYKRSAKLALLVIHRGLVIAVCQTVYSAISRFTPTTLYGGYLMAGYATIYTMAPVFALVLDTDLDESLALRYPELYHELTSGRAALSSAKFIVWAAIAMYQGAAIMLTTLLVTRDRAERMVAISFTALVATELATLALEMNTLHWGMLASVVASAGIYVASIPFLSVEFDLSYVPTIAFFWRTSLVAAVALAPVYVARVLQRRLRPAAYRKVAGTA